MNSASWSSYNYFSFRLLSDPLIGCWLFEILRRHLILDDILTGFSLETFSSTSSYVNFSHTSFHNLNPNKLQRSASFNIDRSEKSILDQL